ncbi:hypothetical protein [Streptomyces sp. NPDC012825]|uniref:hypothetical protein n=1 Tax=Streptomyces sp. NPDC012825 TaxID=3364851 RepID=UPI00369723DF
MKRINAAVLTVGTVLAVTPARALGHCRSGTGTVIREYGVAACTSKAGDQYEFAIGTDGRHRFNELRVGRHPDRLAPHP